MAILPQGAAQGVSFQTPQQKKQKQRIWILGAVLLAIAGVFYFGFFRSAQPAPPGGMENLGGPSTRFPRYSSGQVGVFDPSIKFGVFDEAAVSQGQASATSTIVLTPEIVEILKRMSAADLAVQDKRFGNLVIHGAFPVVAGEKGRENPFAAF